MGKHLLSRVQACLLGVQIGDAMGMPWEMMTHKEIMAATDKKGVNDFMMSPVRRLYGTRHLELGQTTDDWALTAAVAKSLLGWNGFSISDIAKEHLAVMKQCDFGWGKTTKDAMAEIELFFAGHGGRDPQLPAKPSTDGRVGCGNGVAMKVAPLAIWHAVRFHEWRPEPLLSQVMKMGLMTHPDPRASFAAYVLAALMVRLLVTPNFEGVEALKQFCFAEALHAEYCYGHLNFESFGEPLSRRINQIVCSYNYSDIGYQIERMGKGFHALESVPFALAVFLKNRTPLSPDHYSFVYAMDNAITSGGDTDSNASMVAALMGAQSGLGIIPEKWRNFRPEYQESLELGEKLFFAAQKQNVK